MCFRILLTVLFTLLALSLPVPGKSLTQTEQVLSLNQAVVIALHNNPSLAQQVNAVESAEITVSQQQTNYYPDLVLGASGSQRFDQALDQSTGQNESRNFTAMSVELSSSVNLFNGFADIAALKNAELLLGAERESLSQEEQTLIFETVSQFIQVLTDQELIHVEEINLEENSTLLKKVESFYKAGKLPISDLYQQQAEIKQAELDLLEANNNLKTSKLLLMQTIGFAPTVHYQVAPPDFEGLSLPIPDEEQDQLALLALANRSDVKAQEQQVKAAGQQILGAQAGRLPKVDLFASLATDNSDLSDESDFSEQFNDFTDEFMDDNLNATVGITFSIPLFDHFLTRNNIVKAKIEQRNEQLILKQTKLQVGLEIAQAIQEYRKTQQQVDVVESKLTYARQALHSYEERYRVGASTLVELTQARTQYVTAASDRVQVKYDLVTRKISVAYYLGNLQQMLAPLSLEKN